MVFLPHLETRPPLVYVLWGKIKRRKQTTFIIKRRKRNQRRRWYIEIYLAGGRPPGPPLASGGRGARLKTSALGDLASKIYFKLPVTSLVSKQRKFCTKNSIFAYAFS